MLWNFHDCKTSFTHASCRANQSNGLRAYLRTLYKHVAQFNWIERYNELNLCLHHTNTDVYVIDLIKKNE